MVTGYALIFALLIGIAVAFQIALAFGAPWGEWANGGRWRGTLPNPMRVAAIAQSIFLLGLTVLVLSHAGLITWNAPAWAIWFVAGTMALSSIMNIATPSIKERKLWAPIVTLACISATMVGFLV